jgi:hypothetical protein
MSEQEIQALIEHYAQEYPRPLLTAKEAAAIAGRAVGTIHNWSSLGRLDGLKSSTGLRINRDAFVRLILTGAAEDGDDDGA